MFNSPLSVLPALIFLQIYLNPNSQMNQLYGPSGSVHDLEFVVSNLFRGGHFSFEQTSEDGFVGRINAVGGAYLEEGEQKIIRVSGMVVPERQEGARIKYTFTVRKEGCSGNSVPV